MIRRLSAAPCRRKRSRSAGTVSAPSKTEKDTAWSFRRHADRLKYRKNKEFNLYGIQNHHKPDGSEQKLAVYDGKCRFWMEGLYDSLPDTAEKRAEECSLPVKIDRREDGTVSVGTQSLCTVGNPITGKLEIMADVYLNYLAQVFNLPDDDYVRPALGVRLGQRRPQTA